MEQALEGALDKRLEYFLSRGDRARAEEENEANRRFIEVQGDCRGGIICLRRGIKLFKEEHVFLRDSRKDR